MKHGFTKVAVLAIAIIAAGFAWSDDDELASVQAKVSEKFPEIKAEHVFAGPLDGWYTIRKGAIVAYISADGRYLMQGDMIDLDRQVNLSETSRNDARAEMMATFPEDELIVFTPEEKRYSV